MSEVLYYHHGRFQLAGGVLPNAITAYRTYGNPKNPCILFPTCYGGRLDNRGLMGQDYMIGEDKVLNPSKYYIVTVALFSNGESSSPSNTPAPYNGPHFPHVSYEDNIRAQHALLTKGLGIEKLFCVIGVSMGGQQAYHWAAMYPDFVERFVAICSAARTNDLSRAFQEGFKAAFVCSKDFDNGYYKTRPEIAMHAFSRAIGPWIYSQAWFAQKGYLHDGMVSSMENFMCGAWDAGFLPWDANDLLVLMRTWGQGDISLVNGGNGDLAQCLANVKAKGLIMPCKTDLFFPPEENIKEVASMRGNGRLALIDSIWGHMSEL
ncbi:homoserine acetyltransferase [Laetiporus sulphureus 93-53]|uniref:Homoserine acetyltransferase n=1 Tax=Laetiporus sulphureus 93-53 TaxID=1314785 RepID=A0A165GTZ1_9APHY|nr:homoserine acetyltransferase [Laetiporus sulphureus 93-53]KZT10807.1 homoserine acetyltransferase [Laetiporus sulphureus 93-53]